MSANEIVVAGVGCRGSGVADEIIAIVERAESEAGLRATVLAAPMRKSAGTAVRDAAMALGLPLRYIDDAAMEEAQAGCVTRSETVRRHVGFASVAEAAALAAAGAGARLVLPRIANAHATCALAAGISHT